MKNFKFLQTWLVSAGMLVLLLTFAATNTGCKKESIAEHDGNTTSALALATECEKDGDCTDILCMLDDANDFDNKKVNMITYHYAQAVKAAMADPSLRCILVNAAITDVGSFGVSLHSLAAGNASLASTLNTALRQSMAANYIYPRGVEAGVDALIANTSWDANSYLKSRIIYSGVSYEPVVYFIKSPTSCTTSEPISVIIGEEVNCCDEVPGWTDGTFTLFDEAEIIASTAINIFVGYGTPLTPAQLAGTPIVLYKPTEDVIDTRAVLVDIDTDQHQIKAGFRHESNCKSEVLGWRIVFTPGSQVNTGNTIEWEDFDPKKISKDDIDASKIFTGDNDAFKMGMPDFDAGRSIFFGTCEWDWGKPIQTIINPCSPLIQYHQIFIRMKNSTDVYFIDCGVASSLFPTVGTHKIESNNKCMFDMVRKV